MFTDSGETASSRPTEITALRVQPGWTTPWQRLVSDLPALERLTLSPEVGADPTSVSSWPRGLRSLTLHLPEEDAEELVAAWVRAVPGLTQLTLWVRALPSSSLPNALAELAGLEELVVKSKVAVELPPGLAGGALRRLALSLPPGELPASVCALSQLEELRLDQQIRVLPGALAELENLHTLDLSRSLNGGTTAAEDHPASHFQPMPTVIARLPALRTLVLDMCGIFERDLLALAGHPRLETLSVAYSGLSDLSPVRELPALRSLDLKASDRLRDLTPLRGLPLRHLGLDSCTRIRDLAVLLDLPELHSLSILRCEAADLSPVLRHPALQTVRGSEEQQAAFARRGELSGHSPEGIRTGLSSADTAEVLDALAALATWVSLTSTPEHNTLLDLFELPPGARAAEDPMEIPSLAAALDTPDLPPKLAAQVFAACFSEVRDNFAPALQAAEIVIERGSDEDQRALAQAVLHARRFYDAGHRAWEPNVHETLLDVHLPRLRAPALAHLLDGLSEDDISSDALEDLFPAAYATADAATTATLDGRLRRYMEERREYAEAEDIISLLDKIGEAQPEAAERLSDLRPPPAAEGWAGRLRDASAGEDASQALTELAGAFEEGSLSSDDLKPLFHPVQEALSRAGLIEPALARRLLLLARAVDYDGWLSATVLMPLVRSDLDWLLGLDERTRRLVSRQLSGLQRHASRSDGERLITARARLEGVDPEAMRRQTALEEIDRAMRSEPSALVGALATFAEDPFPLAMDGKRTRTLARALDALRFTGLPEDTVDLMDELLRLRPHLDWSPDNQQYVLTYLLPLAAEKGPDFFEEHVAPWLEDQAVVEPRFAYNLACYQARHGDTEALCAAIEQALQLGKPRSQFLADSDFAGRIEEPAVQRVLSETKAPPRYLAMSRVDHYDAPCRFVDKGWKPDRPFWWKHDWQGGRPLQREPELPMRFLLKPYMEHAEVMSRELPLLHLRKVPVMHERLVSVLEENGAKLETFPAVLVDPDDDTEHGGYFAVNVLGVLKPEALGRFHGRVADAGHIDQVGFSQVSAMNEPLDGLVLAWIEDTFTLVAFEPLVDALKAAGFTELQFHELSEIAM